MSRCIIYRSYFSGTSPLRALDLDQYNQTQNCYWANTIPLFNVIFINYLTYYITFKDKYSVSYWFDLSLIQLT